MPIGAEGSHAVKLKPDMLRSAKSLHDYHVQAIDGNVGRVKDFLFDTREWVVRYAVVETSEWHRGKMVLLIPGVLGAPSAEGEILPVDLTRDQVENSPALEAGKPVSRRHELEWFGHYGRSPCRGASPDDRATRRGGTDERVGRSPEGNPNLASMRAVTGYAIRATDGAIGHVEDFILEDETWIVRYIVVNTRHWLDGQHVIVAPEGVEGIDEKGRTVSLSLSREEVKNSPPYDPHQPVNRQYEVHLYDYYGRPKYW